MNHIYRLVWNHALRAWAVASEIARGHGRRGSSAALVVSLISAPAFALDGNALPSGGAVSSGKASIGRNGSTLTVNQQSQNVAINWQDFNVGAKATVNFAQPNGSSIALNRVLGSNGTEILGRLNANGQVWVLNPNGVLFGRGAQVDVGGLVASTLGISDADFMAGKRRFAGDGGSVVNQGAISADYVALLGEQVRNEGAIVARLGTVAMGAGSQVTLDFAGDRLLGMQIDQGALKALADNKGLIQADGGAVLMSAKARDALIDTVVNNTGVIQARTLENRDGRILLIGDMASGTVNVSGTLDASAPDGGNGGFIETSAAHVKVADSAKVTTKAGSGGNGTWLIDPVDFTIAASGGDMTGAAVGNALANGNFTIQSGTGASGTNGDINVRDTVSWTENLLTLDAQRNININAQMNASGSAGLALEYGQGAVAAGNTALYNISAPVNLASTGSFSTKLGSDGGTVHYTIITSLGAEGSMTGTDLQGMWGDLGGNYVLGADIDASATAGWNGGAGFNPIAQRDLQYDGFTGRFDGLGHVIDRLTIDRPSQHKIGLFGNASGPIANLGLTRVSINGGTSVGALVGHGDGGLSIRNVWVDGSVTGTNAVGGLVGDTYYSGLISHVYSSADVTATAAASGGFAGGLVGALRYGTLEYGYATGAVRGRIVGGLVGTADYQSGSPAKVLNSYFAGTVGGSDASPTPAEMGALIGSGVLGQFENLVWNVDTVGASVPAVSVSTGATLTNVNGLTTAQMRDAANWAGFDFATAPGSSGWAMVDGVLPMLASEWSTAIRNAHQLQLMALDKRASYTLLNDIDASATDGKDVWLGGSFASVGTWGTGTEFRGSLDGLGHTIDDLRIDAGYSNNAGLFGVISDSTIRNVGLQNASVSGYDYVGGVAGYASDSSISNAYVTGSVAGNDQTGGLIGYGARITVDNAYSAASVTGNDGVGGLAGVADMSSISNTYATGSVTGNSNAGGLLGSGVATAVANSYYASTAAGGGAINNGGMAGGAFGGNAYGSARTYAALTDADTFAGWNLDTAGGGANVWRIYDGATTPLLKAFLKRLDATVNNDSTVYNGSAQGSAAGYTVGAHDGSLLLGTGNVTGGGTNAGGYALTLSGLYSTQRGYDIVAANGVLTIEKAPLSVTVGDITKTYDGTTSANGTAAISSGTLYGGDTLSGGSFAYADKNAGMGKVVTVSGVVVSDGNGGGNYDISYVDNTNSTIDKANATVTANSGTVTYNGQTQRVAGFTVTGLMNNETASVLAGLTESGGVGIDAGRYVHAFSGADGNYALTFVDGALTIDPAESGGGTGGAPIPRMPALPRYVAANVSATAADDKPRIASTATAALRVDRPECQMNLPVYLLTDNCK